MHINLCAVFIYLYVREESYNSISIAIILRNNCGILHRIRAETIMWATVRSHYKQISREFDVRKRIFIYADCTCMNEH